MRRRAKVHSKALDGRSGKLELAEGRGFLVLVVLIAMAMCKDRSPDGPLLKIWGLCVTRCASRLLRCCDDCRDISRQIEEKHCLFGLLRGNVHCGEC